MNADYLAVLNHFSPTKKPTQIESLGSAGGFSGAQLYRISAGSRRYCLRRWPSSHPNAEQLRFIHTVLSTARRHCDFIPAPLPTVTSETFLPHTGHLWELTPWMRGEASYHAHPNREKLSAAMTALATFHTATFHAAATHLPAQPPHPATPPGIIDRAKKLDQLLAGRLDQLSAAIDDSLWPAFADRSRQLINLFPQAAGQVRHRLDNASKIKVPLGPCIRDVWHDHLLLTDNRVTGLVDFGAMRIDSVATDIARLLGSLVADDSSQRQFALDAYDAIRPLSGDEHSLLIAYDQSGTLMSGLAWIDWIFRERRQFEHRDTILARVDANIRRLTQLASR